jgi:hypothetical protein
MPALPDGYPRWGDDDDDDDDDSLDIYDVEALRERLRSYELQANSATPALPWAHGNLAIRSRSIAIARSTQTDSNASQRTNESVSSNVRRDNATQVAANLRATTSSNQRRRMRKRRRRMQSNAQEREVDAVVVDQSLQITAVGVPLINTDQVTYFTIELVNPTSWSKCLGTTNSCYDSSISSLSNKDPIYIVLVSDPEDISVSFLHVRALCPVPPQFPQRRTVGWALS